VEPLPSGSGVQGEYTGCVQTCTEDSQWPTWGDTDSGNTAGRGERVYCIGECACPLSPSPSSPPSGCEDYSAHAAGEPAQVPGNHWHCRADGIGMELLLTGTSRVFHIQKPAGRLNILIQLKNSPGNHSQSVSGSVGIKSSCHQE